MRIPVTFGGTPGPDDAALVEDGQDMPKSGYAVKFSLSPAPGHPSNCACCTPRGPAADALAAMFQARARGTAPYFKRVTVLASPKGQAAIQTALETDLVIRSRYRLK